VIRSPPPRRRPGPRRGKNASTKHSPRTPESTKRFRLLDASRSLEIKRYMRIILEITELDTSGKSSVVANVMTKAQRQGIDETVEWLKEIQLAGTITAEQAERITTLLNAYARWR